jgi:rod shape-determining protein MreC
LKNFLKQHGLWVLFAAAVIAVALALLSYFSNTSSPLANLAGVVTSPFRAAYTAVAEWFNDKQNYYQDNKDLKAENEELKNQIAKMEEQVRQAQADSEENTRLRELLNLRQKHQSFDLEAASVTEHSSSNWTSSLTLNRGTRQDVAKGDCVITESGFLVGVVDEVGLNWCTVLNIIDTDTSLGAEVFRTSDLGIAEGDFNLMGQGKLKLGYLPADAALLNGDLIVTSGLGGYYPSGLVIGSVDEVTRDSSGSAQYAVLTPKAEFDNLSEVFIIKSFDIIT